MVSKMCKLVFPKWRCIDIGCGRTTSSKCGHKCTQTADTNPIGGRSHPGTVGIIAPIGPPANPSGKSIDPLPPSSSTPTGCPYAAQQYLMFPHLAPANPRSVSADSNPSFNPGLPWSCECNYCSRVWNLQMLHPPGISRCGYTLARLKISLDGICNCKKIQCNCKSPTVTALIECNCGGRTGDAASPRGGDTVCNITSKTWSNLYQKMIKKINNTRKNKY
jgi:hypothetical protein